MDEHRMALRDIFRRGYTDLGLDVPEHLKPTNDEIMIGVNKTLTRISDALKKFGDAAQQLIERFSKL